MAKERPITTIPEWTATKATVCIATDKLLVLLGKVVHWNRKPIGNVFDLKDRSRETFALGLADARVGEELSAANVANVPAGSADIVLFLAVIALHGRFAVGSVLGLHVNCAHLVMRLEVPEVC
jgi:hypothetical protein